MTISNRSLFTFVVCAVIAAQTMCAFAESADADAVIDLYESSIRPKASGTYSEDGWVFFHKRIPLGENTGMFQELKAERKAISAVTRDVFAWIDERLGNPPAITDALDSRLSGLNRDFGTASTRVTRSLDGIPSRLLNQYADEDGDFVYTLVFRESDLLAEAKKGPFENRREVIRGQWARVVKEQLTGANRMAFVKACGAMDLWTLESATTSGEKVLAVTNVAESALSCRTCIDDLRKSVAGAGTPAAAEYVDFLDGLNTKFEEELSVATNALACPRTTMMLLSFASCRMKALSPSAEAFDLFSEFVDQTEDLGKTRETMLRLVEEFPGVAMFWNGLGATFLRANSPSLAAASYRNALRIDNNNAYALDGLAAVYAGIGKAELARGAALLAFVLGNDASVKDSSLRLLESLK